MEVAVDISVTSLQSLFEIWKHDNRGHSFGTFRVALRHLGGLHQPLQQSAAVLTGRPPEHGRADLVGLVLNFSQDIGLSEGGLEAIASRLVESPGSRGWHPGSVGDNSDFQTWSSTSFAAMELRAHLDLCEAFLEVASPVLAEQEYQVNHETS